MNLVYFGVLLFFDRFNAFLVSLERGKELHCGHLIEAKNMKRKKLDQPVEVHKARAKRQKNGGNVEFSRLFSTKIKYRN